MPVFTSTRKWPEHLYLTFSVARFHGHRHLTQSKRFVIMKNEERGIFKNYWGIRIAKQLRYIPMSAQKTLGRSEVHWVV